MLALLRSIGAVLVGHGIFAVSAVATLGHGAVWTQVTALLFMAPSAVLGGWWRARGVVFRPEAGLGRRERRDR